MVPSCSPYPDPSNRSINGCILPKLHPAPLYLAGGASLLESWAPLQLRFERSDAQVSYERKVR